MILQEKVHKIWDEILRLELDDIGEECFCWILNREKERWLDAIFLNLDIEEVKLVDREETFEYMFRSLTSCLRLPQEGEE